MKHKRYDVIIAASAPGTDEIICRAEAAITAAEGEKKLPSFKITAYTGGALGQIWAAYPIVVDLAGLSIPKVMPVLADHDTGQRVGHADDIQNDGKKLVVNGVVSATGQTAREIVQDAVNGFPWQASIRAQILRREEVAEGVKVTVNGRSFTGPLYIARQSKLVETSFVALGADGNSSAKVAASASSSGKEKDMKFEEWLKAKGLDAAQMDDQAIAAQRLLYDAEVKASKEKTPEKPVASGLDVQAEMQKFRDAQAAEITRVSAIQAACGSNHADIAAKAVKEGWDEQRTKDAVEVADLRASRPAHPGIITGSGATSKVGKDAIEAALCIRHNVGDSKFLMAQYGQETLNAADTLRKLPFTRIMEIAAARSGIPIPMDVRSDDFIRAAFSTSELSGIVGNVANKALAAAFMAVNTVIPRIAAKRTHGNFHTHTVYSLAVNGDLELVGPDGELKHLSLSEENWTRAVDTRGALLTITRKDIVNDELGAFTDNAARLGRKAAISREKAGFTLLNATGNGSSFFTSGRGNYISGATTTLANDAGIAAALQKFRDQTGPDGDPVMIEPKMLLVPTALEGDALRLFNSEYLLVTGLASTTAKSTQPGNNIYRGRFAPLVSEWMSNSGLTGYSSLAWYLLADPSDVPVMEIAYLNGVEQPTVEYFGLNQDVNTLGVTWRCYFDFGVALAEYRAGVKSKGAA